ncbi:hypothetical protein KR067_013394, partial [Drosophila pandora]
FQLLMLKRSDTTAVVLNQTVFPGGLLDEADESVAWLQYFEEFGVPQKELRRLVLISNDRPAILAPQGTGCYDRFFKNTIIWSREITLRLNAIRECFEEVGVLLCRSHEDLKDFGPVASLQNVPNLKNWQQRVHNKPSEFLTLCRELKVVPDLWGLHEWSAWTSPGFMRKGYETVFFMAFVNSQPNLMAEPSEVKETLWSTPIEFLQMTKLGEIWLLPPQIYELSRLMGVKTYTSLLDFAVKRSALGTTMFVPVTYECEGRMVFVLPGDDFYVPEPHLVREIVSFPGTLKEFKSRSKHIHRYTSEGSVFNVELNFTPPNNHLKPLKFLQERQKL